MHTSKSSPRAKTLLMVVTAFFLLAFLAPVDVFAQPDLVVTNFTVGLGAAGQPVTLDYTITNLGDIGTLGVPFELKVFADQDSPPHASASGNHVAAMVLISADLGPNDAVSGTLQIPDGILSPGYHPLWLLADGDDRIAERDESNNTAGGLTFIDGFPSPAPVSDPGTTGKAGILPDVADITSDTIPAWH